MSLECKVYQRELRVLGYGLPLYEPNPAEYDRVRVGDVGIAHKNGYFRRIFNALPQSDSPPEDININPNYGIPEGFEPLPEACRLTTTSNEISAGSWLQSDHVKQIEGDVDFSVTAASAGARVNFLVSNRQAAALRIKHSAERVDASRIGHYRAYMLKHYKAWARFIRDLGFEFELRDMILVTGHDMTANWATATLIERASQGGVAIQAGDSVMLSGGAAISGISETSIRVPIRVGPNPYNPPVRHQLLSDDSSVIENSGPFKDQCIFLRGFRVSEKLFVPRIMKAAAGPEDLDTDRDSDAHSGVVSVDFDSDEEVQVEEGFVDHNFVLNSILRAGAEVAIVHESDICALAKVTGNNTYGLESVADFRDKGMEIVTEFDHGLQETVGTIRHCDTWQSWVLESETSEKTAFDSEGYDGTPLTLVEYDGTPYTLVEPDEHAETVLSMMKHDMELLEPEMARPGYTFKSKPSTPFEQKAALTVEENTSLEDDLWMGGGTTRSHSIRSTVSSTATLVSSDPFPFKKEFDYMHVVRPIHDIPPPPIVGYVRANTMMPRTYDHRRTTENHTQPTDNNPENLREVIKILQSCIIELRGENIRLREELDASRFSR